MARALLSDAPETDAPMTDVLIVLLTLALYAAAFGFVRLCEQV